MAIFNKLIKFLEENKVKYESVKHRQVFTAQDKAATLKVKPNIIGKTLILKIDGYLVIVLIPGNKNLDKNKFRKVAKAKNLDFISERIMKNRLRGVKVGAIPPFGNLWGLATFVDKSLTLQSKIIVNSGDHNWSIKINPAAFKKLMPDLGIGNFSKPRSR